jgi:Uri superfamily endonuclease
LPCTLSAALFPRGAYILRIDLSRPTKLSFGRFKGGKRVELNAGSYLYIGSAMASKGSTSLAHRVRRHTRRSGSRPTHRIDTALVQHLHNIALLPTPAAALTLKRLHWNVDYLLDLPTATLTAIYLLHSTANIEKSLAEFFSRASEATFFERGLGANDAPGHTHLLYISADSEWWRSLNYRLSTEFYEE